MRGWGFRVRKIDSRLSLKVKKTSFGGSQKRHKTSPHLRYLKFCTLSVRSAYRRLGLTYPQLPRQRALYFLNCNQHLIFSFISGLFLRQGLRVKQQVWLFSFFRSLLLQSFRLCSPLPLMQDSVYFGVGVSFEVGVSKHATLNVHLGHPEYTHTKPGCQAINAALVPYSILTFAQSLDYTPASINLGFVQTSGVSFSQSTDNAHWLNSLFSRLTVAYYVRYRALDRKLRKIVKNRYRYTRQYVAIYPGDRLRVGLRYLRVLASLSSNRHCWARFSSVLVTLLLPREQCPILTVLKKHQQTALRALGLR